MASPTNAERLAVIEVEAAALKVDVAGIKTDVAEVKETLDDIRRDLARYRGAWGAAVLLVVCLWAVVTQFKDWVLAHLK